MSEIIPLDRDDVVLLKSSESCSEWEMSIEDTLALKDLEIKPPPFAKPEEPLSLREAIAAKENKEMLAIMIRLLSPIATTLFLPSYFHVLFRARLQHRPASPFGLFLFS
nr:hypothetical protein L204_05444 [Cryptococcus depauperatus CBS 7855]